VTRKRVVLAGVLALVVLAAILIPLLLGGNGKSSANSPATPTAGPAVSPLTGLPGAAGRIIAVKIDNIVYARPQTGIDSADVVYAIEVEGGLSRFLAIFDENHLPSGGEIGPVRSARESDLPILQQYGKVAFAYSGALTKFLPLLAQANVFNSSPTQLPNAFSRGGGRPAPYNEYVNPATVMSTFPDSAFAHDVGFRFGAAPAGGVGTSSYTARMPAASFTLTWDAASGKYLVAMDGAAAQTTDGGRMGAPTIVIQKVAETTSPHGFHDVPNELSPYAPTVGSGADAVLRGGKSYAGSWSRPTAADGTSYTFGGKPMDFAPGQVWIILEPA
jgi:hypothetical protein